jgi:hypothetical protein
MVNLSPYLLLRAQSIVLLNFFLAVLVVRGNIGCCGVQQGPNGCCVPLELLAEPVWKWQAQDAQPSLQQSCGCMHVCMCDCVCGSVCVCVRYVCECVVPSGISTRKYHGASGGETRMRYDINMTPNASLLINPYNTGNCTYTGDQSSCRPLHGDLAPQSHHLTSVMLRGESKTW